MNASTSQPLPIERRTLRELLANVRSGLVLHRPVLIELAVVAAHPERMGDPGTSTTTMVRPLPTVEAQAREYSHLPVRSIGPNTLMGAGLAPVTLGRSRSCAFRFTEPSVSKVHATLRSIGDSGEYALVDENSRNGTSVDGIVLAPDVAAPLWSGVYLGFGRVTAVFVEPVALRTMARLA